MKKNFSLVLFLFISQLFVAQEINIESSELEPLLCQRWDIEFAKMGPETLEQMPDASDFDIQFKKDGTYNLIKNDETKSGTWIYHRTDQFVELTIKNKVTSRVKFVDENKLILILVSGKNDPPGLPQLEFHFKPL